MAKSQKADFRSRISGLRYLAPATLVAAALVLSGAGCAEVVRKDQPPANVSAPAAATAVTDDQAGSTADAVVPATVIPTTPSAAADAVTAPAATTDVQPVATTDTAAVKPEARVIEVKASQFAFEPAEIRIKKGESVKIRLTSTDVPHGLAITDLNFDLQVEGGQTQEAELTVDVAGSYGFRCSVMCGGGHRDMKGVLIVE